MRRNVFLLSAVVVLLCAPAIGVAGSIRGTVSGPRGPVANARVHLLQEGRELRSALTDAQGRFQLEEVAAGEYQVQVLSSPLLPVVQEISVPTGNQASLDMDFAMQSLSETITVTAERIPTPVVSSISNAKILAADDLRAVPYQSLEERLRSFPEFSLFRRTSSLVAHPTTQGVSLRGIGPSGVSRSLVLVDGIPLNDAFGGWVYWDRIPSLALEQVEITNGGGSTLYGNYALGGVVQLLKRVPEPSTLELQAQGGSNASLKGDLYASHRIGPWGFAVSGAAFDFDGYTLVSESQRGTVDIAAFSRHQAGRFLVEHAAPGTSRVWFLDGGFLNEHRGNGTPAQNNQTVTYDFATGVQFSPREDDRVEIRSFFRRNIFASTFSAVANDRNSERLTTQQHNPSADGGASALWFGTRGAHRLLAGGDFWLVDGESTDNIFFAPLRFGLVRVGGGKQSTVGSFGEENYALSPRATLVLGGRVDVWNNYDGRLGSFPPESPQQIPDTPGDTKVVFSPRAGFNFQASRIVTLYGSIQRSFRSPTLNELYRQFTVGNVVTMANAGLVPEHNTGGEAGSRLQLTGTWRAGLAGFFNVLSDPVSNVTIQTTPTQIIRQRQNLGEARVYGLELSSDWQPASFLKTQVFYLWNKTRVAEFPADPALVDKRLPQVPEHRLSLMTKVSMPRGTGLTLLGRFVGGQSDDDLNQVVLDRYFQLDMQLSHNIGEQTRLFLSLENMTNSRPLLNRSPVDFLGAPFQVRGGLHLRFQRR